MEVTVPDGINYIEVAQMIKRSLGNWSEPLLEPNNVPTETLYCKITNKYVIWPYPKKPDDPPEKVEV